jgi:hypothetical protein
MTKRLNAVMKMENVLETEPMPGAVKIPLRQMTMASSTARAIFNYTVYNKVVLHVHTTTHTTRTLIT